MYIPAICANFENLRNIPKDAPINYYITGGVSESYDGRDLNKEYDFIVENGYDIVMIHMCVPDDVRKTYIENKPYFNFINKLEDVGLTFHYKTPKNFTDLSVLFDQITWVHMECPTARIYIENEIDDLYGVLQFVKALRDVGIDAWMLLDTCHLQMGLNQYGKEIGNHDELVMKTLVMYMDYIGALHISCSRGADGYSWELHGKPILTDEDELYFRNICMTLKMQEGFIGVKNDIILIPEVTEKSYESDSTRENGLKAYDILNEYFGSKVD